MCSRPFYRDPVCLRMAAALLMACALTSPAWATDSSAAAAAVAKLLALPVQGEAPAAAAAADTSTRNTITVQRGESLERVIRRAWPQHPFKEDFVRKAFAQVNPGLLAKASAYRALPAGTVLQVPGADEVQALLSEQYPALAKAKATQHEEASTAPAPAKRRWVQFP